MVALPRRANAREQLVGRARLRRARRSRGSGARRPSRRGAAGSARSRSRSRPWSSRPPRDVRCSSAMHGGTPVTRSTSGRGSVGRNCRAYGVSVSMKRRCPSAKTTSNASELLPEPLGPVTTHSFPCGIVHDTSFRLCSRACSTAIASIADVPVPVPVPVPVLVARRLASLARLELPQRLPGLRPAPRDLLGRALRDDHARRAARRRARDR